MLCFGPCLCFNYPPPSPIVLPICSWMWSHRGWCTSRYIHAEDWLFLLQKPSNILNLEKSSWSPSDPMLEYWVVCDLAQETTAAMRSRELWSHHVQKTLFQSSSFWLSSPLMRWSLSLERIMQMSLLWLFPLTLKPYILTSCEFLH